MLKTRQQASSPRYNASFALEQLTPLHVSDWYGPASPPQDFFLALATMIVTVADTPDKDTVINTQSVERWGYRLNVTNVPLPSQVDYLTYRGVLGLCGDAYGELARRVGFWDPVTDFETMVVWTDGREVVQQHVLRYAGEG